mmetsp:Transcript_34327/g.98955  ORF Transcript_34327/g.98955 Transcript_34327/m.98955 type:complete len:260 (+) Transcript_34327:53-832(+)
MPATYRVAVAAAAACLQLAGASVRDVVAIVGDARRTEAVAAAATAAAPAAPVAEPAAAPAAEPAAADPVVSQESEQSAKSPPSSNTTVHAEDFNDLVAAQPAWVDQVLRAHNEYRCMHDVQQLSWSMALEAHAKQWVVRGHGQRSPPWELQNVDRWARIGENTAWGVTDEGGMKSPVGQVISWYEQIQYTENRNGFVDRYRYELSQYTQMMWRDTTHVGCAWLHEFFVCQYGAAGNIDGQYAAQVPVARRPYQECRQRW